MGGFALSLASGLSWGVGDFLGGLKARRLHSVSILLVSQPFGLLLVVAAMAIAGQSLPAGREAALAAIGGAAGVVALGAFYRALAAGTMSVVAPIASTGVIVPVAFGLTFGEVPEAVQLGGVALAITGVVVLGREEGRGEIAGDQAAPGTSALALALLAALGFGSFFVLMDAAAEDEPLGAAAVARAAGVPVVLAAMAAIRPAPPGRGDLPMLAAIGFFDVMANVTFALATTIGLLALTSVGGSLYPAFTILLAHLILGERLARGQKRGVALALAGVLLIAAGG